MGESLHLSSRPEELHLRAIPETLRLDPSFELFVQERIAHTDGKIKSHALPPAARLVPLHSAPSTSIGAIYPHGYCGFDPDSAKIKDFGRVPVRIEPGFELRCFRQPDYACILCGRTWS
jgi:hypothetical protein